MIYTEPSTADLAARMEKAEQSSQAALENWGGGGPDGDVNEDGIVNFEDILVILGTWGPCP